MYRKMKRCTVAVLSFSMILGIGGYETVKTDAATEHFNDAYEESADWTAYKEEWKDISEDYENISITPGRNESELNFAWYSKTEETPKVRMTEKKDLIDIEKNDGFAGTQTPVTGHGSAGLDGYFSNKVTVTGLKNNTTYYYSVFMDGKWTEITKYETHDPDSYSFLYVGDPQIGASKGQNTADENTKLKDAGYSGENLAARNDSYNWNKVLNNAEAQHGEASFMVSAGDQVNVADNEAEYAGYLGADALRSLAVATTIGNHDSTSDQYSYHYNNPNSFDGSDEKYTLGKTNAGTDYYYRYGNSLFIVLDTNNYNCATHENVMKKAIDENKDAVWRFVTFHQDIYGSGYDHSDSDGIVLRTQLTPLMDKYDIDVVLQGHDHTYSRSYQLTNDGLDHRKLDRTDSQGAGEKTDEASKAEKAAYLAENQCYDIVTDSSVSVTGEGSGAGREAVDPEGTVYFEANSSTGSKFYNLIPTQQDYIYERSQTWEPSYSVAHVSETAFTLTTYDAKSGAVMEGSSTYTIVKQADKKALKKDTESAEKMLEEKENYTFDSAWNLQRAVDDAYKVINDKKAGKAEVGEKAAGLSEAVAGLEKKEAEHSENTEVPEKTEEAVNTETPASADETAVPQTIVPAGTETDMPDTTEIPGTEDTEEPVVTKSPDKMEPSGPDASEDPSQTETKKPDTSTAPEKERERGNEDAAAKTAAPAGSSAASPTSSPAAPDVKSAGKEKTASGTEDIELGKVSGLKVRVLGNGRIKVSYKAAEKAEGYEIQYSEDKKFRNKVNILMPGKKSTGKKIKGLKKGKLYVRARALKKTGGLTVASAFTKKVKVIVK